MDYTVANKKVIKEQIRIKNSKIPYFVDETIYDVNNNYRIFPYPNWFKGEAKSFSPKVAEREAGWIPKLTKQVLPKPNVEPNNTCFQVPCSTIFPCYSSDNNYLYTNSACINVNY